MKTKYFINNSLFLETLNSESECTGSLTIAHEDDRRNIHYLSLVGHRTQYPNIKRGFRILRRNIISHLEVFGNCCWELYPDRKFRGKKQIISPGGDIIYPDFPPTSIKKVHCVK